MGIGKILLSYLLTAIVFFAIDMVWLGVVARNIYQKYLGNFLASQVNWTAAIIFYFLFIVGILVFAVYPAVSRDSVASAIILGALFGFIAYATYDLTNLATLKDWPIQIVVIDMVWGAVLSALVSTAGFYIVRYVS
jgi:uncharacterized membrane protein